MKLIDNLHERRVRPRRSDVLTRHLTNALRPAVDESSTLLDVGCGDGKQGRAIADELGVRYVTGVEFLVRPVRTIPMAAFDGHRLPFADRSVTAAMACNVLHHANDPAAVLAEMCRVADRAVVLKDHLLNGPLAGATLKFMDDLGNKKHGVALPYHYWPRDKWHTEIARLGWRIDFWTERLRLYPFPANLLFDRHLHFVARLVRA